VEFLYGLTPRIFPIPIYRFTDISQHIRFLLFLFFGATANARPENAGLENDGQHFSKLLAKLRGLENAGLENDGPC